MGDDAICIKSGKDEYGRQRGRPTEDVVIDDCIVYHGHGGFTVGSEMSGGVRNILVERCTFLGTDVGLRFKTTRGRGGVVEKIWIRDIQMTDIPTDAIGFNMYYGGEAPTDVAGASAAPRPSMPVNEGTPQFRDIVLSRILCRGAGRAVMLEGLPEMPIRGIVLDDVRITATHAGWRRWTPTRSRCAGSRSPRRPVRRSPCATAATSRSRGAPPHLGTTVYLRVDGAATGGIRVSGVDLTNARTAVETGASVPAGAVVRK